MKSFLGSPALVLPVVALLCSLATAQQPTAGSDSDGPAKAVPPQSKTQQEKQIEKREQSQRILSTIPQFFVTSRQNAPPLTSLEKFRLSMRSAFDPVEFGVVGLQAGISQATDEFSSYGQGAAGYGKRYGATLADEVSATFFGGYLWPVLLKEDPRYFRLGEGSIKHRIAYLLAQSLICHTDKGSRSFNYSNVLGAFSAGALSNSYYPANDRGFGLTMSRAGIALMYGSLGNLVDEFYADISRKLFHKERKD